MKQSETSILNTILDDAPEPISMTTEELKQAIKYPLSNSRYISAVKRKIRKPRPAKHERIFCEVCRTTYTQSNVSHHKKSKHHIFCEDINRRILGLVYS